MSISVFRTANLMRSAPTVPMSNTSLQKSNSELVSAMKYSLSHPDDQMPQLQDDRSEYEVTAKLFFLPNDTTEETSEWANYIPSALRQVSESLGTETIDLLILSFPHIVLDAEDSGTFTPDELSPILQLYNAAADFIASKRVKALGVSELSASKLQQLCDALPETRKPEVNQINLKDCCVTPRDLIVFAKREKIKLFTHGDASDILPTETMRGVMHGKEVRPRWVCKYTAVASSRGVVENKGYLVGYEKEEDA